MQSNAQLDGALEFLGKLGSEALDRAAFEEAAGVGVEVTPEQLRAAVAEVIEAHRERLLEERCVASGGLSGDAFVVLYVMVFVACGF